jgi:hypothetical protein
MPAVDDRVFGCRGEDRRRGLDVEDAVRAGGEWLLTRTPEPAKVCV